MGSLYPKHVKGMPPTFSPPTFSHPENHILIAPSIPHQLHPHRHTASPNQLSAPHNPARPNPLHPPRKSRSRAQRLVPPHRHRLQHAPKHETANARLLTQHQSDRPPRLALRETSRLERRLRLERRRDPHLGIDLRLQHRRSRRQRQDLLREHALVVRRRWRAKRLDPGCETRG